MGETMKIYIMPDGKKYQFADDKVPEGAVLAKKKAEKKPEKIIEEKKAAPKNKAKKPANKSKKAATK